MESIFSILSAVPDHRKGNHLVYPLDYILLVKITEKEADYILNVKSNQKGTLLEADGLFKPFYEKEIVRIMSEGCGHGRVKKRVMESIIDPMRFSDLEHYISLNKWQNMRSVHKMTRVRYDKRTGKESREAVSYTHLTLPTTPYV